MKICRKCKEEKPLDLFYRNKQNMDGRYNSCKECVEMKRRIANGVTNPRNSVLIRIPAGALDATCYQCDETKPLDNFLKSGKGPTGYKRLCKNCHAMNERTVRRANPDIARNNNLKSSYDITIDEWDTLFYSQFCRCAICYTDEFGSRNPETDHDHTTGQIRGILCHFCNITVGHVENGWSVEVPAINHYLKRWELCRTKS